MYPVAANLTEGDALPDGDEVARYCRPSAYDLEQGAPTVLAFMKREAENDVSVNHLQFFRGHDRAGSVDCIRREVGGYLTLGPNGRFVAFNVARAKAVAKEKGFDVRIIYIPEPSRPSHSSIVDLPTDPAAEVRVAAAILRLIRQTDIDPAVL